MVRRKGRIDPFNFGPGAGEHMCEKNFLKKY